MNHFNNWSVVALAIVLAFCGVRFNAHLSSLNDKVSHLIEENAELRHVDTARSLDTNVCPTDTVLASHYGTGSSRRYCRVGTTTIPAGAECVTAFKKDDGMEISCRNIVDATGASTTDLVDACCKIVPAEEQIRKVRISVARTTRSLGAVLANPNIAASMVCPADTLVTPHYGSDTSDAYCDSGTSMQLATGSKCVSAFMIADGRHVACDEVIDPNSRSNLVNACCKAQPQCPTGSKKAVHYGSTPSDSYCNSGTTTVKPGSECVGAFLMPGGTPYDCSNVWDPTSRTNKVVACCKETSDFTCPTNSEPYTFDATSTHSDLYCFSQGKTMCVTANKVSDGTQIDCKDTINEDVHTCCASPGACIDGMPAGFHDGSIPTKDLCSAGNCAYGIKLEDQSQVDCDIIVDGAGETYVQGCCYP